MLGDGFLALRDGKLGTDDERAAAERGYLEIVSGGTDDARHNDGIRCLRRHKLSTYPEEIPGPFQLFMATLPFRAIAIIGIKDAA